MSKQTDQSSPVESSTNSIFAEPVNRILTTKTLAARHLKLKLLGVPDLGFVMQKNLTAPATDHPPAAGVSEKTWVGLVENTLMILENRLKFLVNCLQL
jgi:hypothetical protein